MARSRYRKRGVTNLGLLNLALRGRAGPLAFYALRSSLSGSAGPGRSPLLHRKAALAELLRAPPSQILYSEHLPRRGRMLFDKIGELGGEGIVSKRLDALHLGARPQSG